MAVSQCKHKVLGNPMQRIWKAWTSLYNLLADPAAMSYYPEQKRKSTVRIWLDHLIWIARHQKINHYYYVYGLDRKEGFLEKDYLAENEFCRIRNQHNVAVHFSGRRASYLCLLRDKFIFGQYLKSLEFPTPEIIALCDSEQIQWLDTGNAKPLESILQIAELDVFVKELLGECGTGVYPVRIRNGELYLNNQRSSFEEFSRKINGLCIMQERISQHPHMKKLNPVSINSIRIVTARNISDNSIVALGSVLRIGSDDSQCDNWATGGIIVGIDMDSGRLESSGMFKPGFGKKTPCHPKTQAVFEDFEIPYYAQAVELVKNLHLFFYGTHSIGWDVAISSQGPLIIEGNDNWDTQLMQVHDHQIKSKFLKTLKNEMAIS